ncbi:MAG: helix-turn-helix transcriptional regulator [Clostridia bacterium]|nr:helix-turn-helix transcriptional regulator [Clostridia bacterium]
MNVNFTKDLIWHTIGTDFNVLENDLNLLLNLFNKKSNKLLYSVYNGNKQELEKFFNFNSNVIYQFNWLFNGVIYAFCCKNKVYVIGPTLTEPFNEIKATYYLKELGIEKESVKNLLFLGASMPYVEHATFIRLVHFLYAKVCKGKNKITTETINLFKNKKLELTGKEKENTVEKIRIVEERYEISTTLTEAVKSGNFSLAMAMLSNYNLSEFNPRTPSPLRNVQNYCIVLNTQLRQALQGQIHSYLLDKISNENGLEIEKITSIKEANTMILKIIKKYCDLVLENKFVSKKPLINLVIQFIKEHLVEELTVKEIAKELNVNANYLSTLFHKEMNLKIIEFINKERIDQAITLLKNTNLQVQEIARLVGYNESSYFTKTFKKVCNKSPKDYRK